MPLPYGNSAVGGAYIANVEKYNDAGGENEIFHTGEWRMEKEYGNGRY